MQPKVSVHGKFTSEGQPASGMVQFADLAFSIDSIDNVVHTPVLVEQFLDQNGEFWAVLPLNVGSDSSPQPRSYHCTVSVEGFTTAFDFVLSAVDLVIEFSDLLPVVPVPALPAQYVASIGGMTGNISYADFTATFPTLSPSAGKSAYQLWLDDGHAGSFDDFLIAITGPHGGQGEPGPTGLTGADGPRGPRGPVGPRGRPFFVVVVLDTIDNLSGTGTVVVDGNNIGLPVYSIVAVRATNSFYMFDGSEWVNLGSYQGPQGVAGHVPTATEIGLGNVDNTRDLTKPVSGPQQAALDDLAHTVGQVRSVNAMIGDVVISKSEIGLDQVDNTSDAVKLAPLTSQVNYLTTQMLTRQTVLPGSGSPNVWLNGTLNWAAPTPAQVGLGKVQNFPNMATLTTEDLNSVLTTGSYHQPSNVVAAGGRNYPIGWAGFLVVTAQNSGTLMVVQYYTTYGHATQRPITFRRSTYATSGWSEWLQLPSADPTPPSFGSAIVAVSGWRVDTQNTFLIQPNLLSLTAICTRTGAAIPFGPSGNIGNLRIANLSGPFHPALPRFGLSGAAAGRVTACNLGAGGDIDLCALGGTSDFATNEQLSFGGLVPLVSF